ncbi:MAG TPA: guanylate kinase [Lachnospiraceae bacterium]|nr:guanylate kinase [Lachnospiraceae bacterium]
MSLLVIMGKSASGKDLVVNELIKKHDYKKLVAYTTRPMRDDEKQDATYHFISEEEFIGKIKDDFFAEYRKYLTVKGIWYYGSAKEDCGTDDKLIAILPPEGVESLKSKGINPTVIYLYSNQATIKNRLAKRGDDKDEAERRMKADNTDFRRAEMLADRIVYNNGNKSLEEVVDEIAKWGGALT